MFSANQLQKTYKCHLNKQTNLLLVINWKNKEFLALLQTVQQQGQVGWLAGLIKTFH